MPMLARSHLRERVAEVCGIAGGVDVPVPPELADDDSTRDDVEARAYEHEIDDHSELY